MLCNKCGFINTLSSANFCAKCGSSLKQSSQTQVDSTVGFFSKLLRGDYGLARTYWLFGVLVGVGFNLLFDLVKSVGVLVILFTIYLAYEVMLIMGIWRAATKYDGYPVWSFLAKTTCIFGGLVLIVSAFAILNLVIVS